MNKKLAISLYIDNITKNAKTFNDSKIIINNAKLIMEYIVENRVSSFSYYAIKNINGIIDTNNSLLYTVHMLTYKPSVLNWIFYKYVNNTRVICSSKEALKNINDVYVLYEVNSKFIDTVNLF